MSDNESRLREAKAKLASEARNSPIFRGMTQEQREARIARALRNAERTNPDSTRVEK
jgi:hypothetical protein